MRFDPATRRHRRRRRSASCSGLPDGGNHWTRTVDVGPDGKLYVSIGSSCNVCIEKDPRRAAICAIASTAAARRSTPPACATRSASTGSPATGALYATDNGRDLLGDDFPPCELNRIVAGRLLRLAVRQRRQRVPDPDFGAGHDGSRIATADSARPRLRRAQRAARHDLLRGATPPGDDYAGAAFVAQHGSWNRSHKDGYKVVACTLRTDGTIEERDFATGFDQRRKVIGRPVDVAVGRDGALYVSDDYTGTIYRVVRSGAKPPAGAAAAAEGRRPPLLPSIRSPR